MRHLDEGTLHAWLDRERSGLSPAERAEIELHLSRCPACARALAELVELSERAAALLAAPEPDDAAIPPYEAVLARANRRRVTVRRRSVWRASGWAASVAVALGAGWMANDLYRSRAVVDSFVPDELAETASGAPAAEALEPEPGAPAVEEREPQPVARPATPVAPAERAEVAAAGEERRDAVEARARRARAAVMEGFTHEPADRSVSVRPVVSGRVTDESGRPLAGAQVVVEGTGLGAVTDGDGTFSIPLDPAPDSGTDVTLRAELVGYAAERRTLPERGGDELSADFELAQSRITLDAIVVTGAGVAREARPARAAAAPSDVVVSPSDDAGSWRAVERAEAEALAGFRPLTVAELKVIRIEVGEAEDGATLVRVVQALDDGSALDLVQARGPMRFSDGAGEDGRVRATIRRGGVTIAAAAPVSLEALEALLARVR